MFQNSRYCIGTPNETLNVWHTETKQRISLSDFEALASFAKFLKNRCYSLELPVYAI